MINKLINKNVINFFLFTATLSSLLLWELASVMMPTQIHFNNFLKFSLILFLPLCFVGFKKIKLLFFFLIIFIFQEILIKYYHYINGYNNLRHYLSIIFFLCFIIVLKKFHNKIFFFTIKIINYFIFCFFFLTLVNILFKEGIIINPESCSIIAINFKLFFSENAHISFLLPSILFYSLWRTTHIYNHFQFFILLSVLLLSFLYLSLSMIFGVLMANLIIFLSSYKVLNLKFKIFSLLISFIFILTFITKPACSSRIVDLLKEINVIKLRSKNINFNDDNINSKTFSSSINFSSKVYLDSINTASNSIVNYPFGSGLNNFQLLNDKFMLRVTDRDINAFSGRSVLLKMITEFGIFSLIFFIMLIIITFSSKINNEKKIFLLPIILIQLVSGEGYFNGFFLISLLILYFSHGDKNFL